MCLQINRSFFKNEMKNSEIKKSEPINQPNKPKEEIKGDSVLFKNLKQGKIINTSISIELSKDINKDVNISNEEIFKKIQNFQGDYKIKKGLSLKQKSDIEKFNPDQKKMLVKALNELENFKNGKIKASDYMMNLFEYASELSGNDSKKFINLTGEVFSEVPDALDFFRKVLGAGPKTSGAILEPLYEEVIKTRGGAGTNAGLNENIVDDVDINNTTTHHIGEFLQVGYNRGEHLGKLADDIIDRDIKIIGMKFNEGDIRSAYFASILGDAMKDKKINPQQAVKMIRWTYTNEHNGKEPPPFGSKETQGNFTKWKDYKIDNWIKAYNKAFPNDKII